MRAKTKAKFAILSTLLSYPTIGGEDWNSSFMQEDRVRVGDLISLHSAPISKWYVSWVIEIDVGDKNEFTRYLLESIEDGELCWWCNVGFSWYDRKRVMLNPKWRWSDKQFALSSRWYKVCNRNDCYIVLPRSITFDENGGVTLDVRIRFHFSEFQNPKRFQKWKTLRMKEMEEYYLASVEKYNEEKPLHTGKEE